MQVVARSFSSDLFLSWPTKKVSSTTDLAPFKQRQILKKKEIFKRAWEECGHTCTPIKLANV